MNSNPNSKNYSDIFTDYQTDPVARRLSWKPVKPGGSSFRTHRLVRVQPGRIEFRSTLIAWLFYLAFLIFGAGMLSYGLFIEFSWLFVIPGGIFAALGLLMCLTMSAPIIFDQRTDSFNRGWLRRQPREARISEIYALQIVVETCEAGSNRHHGSLDYQSWELNLVMADAKIINVIDHGDRVQMFNDAAELANFLGRPLWIDKAAAKLVN